MRPDTGLTGGLTIKKALKRCTVHRSDRYARYDTEKYPRMREIFILKLWKNIPHTRGFFTCQTCQTCQSALISAFFKVKKVSDRCQTGVRPVNA